MRYYPEVSVRKSARMADESAKNGIFLAFVSCVVFAVLGVLLAKPFFHMQTADTQNKRVRNPSTYDHHVSSPLYCCVYAGNV